MTHSPGPWHVHMGHLIKCDIGLVIANVEKHPSCIIKGARVANARLIAAAPDMLAILKKIYRLKDNPYWESELYEAIEEAKAVIMKAEEE